jgi:hypothetical protein
VLKDWFHLIFPTNSLYLKSRVFFKANSVEKHIDTIILHTVSNFKETPGFSVVFYILKADLLIFYIKTNKLNQAGGVSVKINNCN